MPITGPASYVPTSEAFLNHWTAVNGKLPAAEPFVIPGPPIGLEATVTLATLQGFYDELTTQHSAVQAAIMTADLAFDDITELKTWLLDKLNQFNDKVRGLMPGSKFERRLPLIPALGAGRFNIIEPIETGLNLWTRINADGVLDAGAPLVLREGVTLADFSAKLTALRTAYRTWGKLDDALSLDREERNDIQSHIYPILKQYRILMPTFFKPDDALVDSLPLLTPTSNKTPAPVKATGTFDAAQAKAKIEWEASTEADLSHFEVRWSPGTVYHAADESTLAKIQPDEPRAFFTDVGLAKAGDKALYEVYVVLKSGTESASAPVAVTRP